MASTINASTSPAAIVQTADGTGILSLQTGNTTAVTIDASQNVLIGATSASGFDSGADNLIVGAGSGSTGTTIYSGTAGVGTINFADGNSGSAIYAGGINYNHSNNKMSFYTNDGTSRMTIDSSGQTILGSNTSSTPYNVLNLYSPASTLNGIFMEKLSQVVVQMGFKATTNTDFFIGTGSYTLGTYGVYLANTGTSWISNSDERQKDIIEPIENALTKVNTLRAVIGKYKHDEEGVRRSFLIAQDVQAVFPEAVKIQDDEEAKLGLSYTDVIPLLVASIKELKAELDTAKTRITALEGA